MFFNNFFSSEWCLINGTNGCKTKKFGIATISTIFFCNWSLSDLTLVPANFGHQTNFCIKIDVCPSWGKIGHFWVFLKILKVPRVSGDSKTIFKNLFIAHNTGVLHR